MVAAERCEAGVDCGGAIHRIVLTGGDVVLLDHDETAERALQALGGGPVACLRLAASWRDPPWTDAVPLLLLDDPAAAAIAAGKSAAAAGLVGRIGSSRPALAAVERLVTSAALAALPGPFRRACGRRALVARIDRWCLGTPMPAEEREHLERQLDPFVGRRLHDEGRHLPPGGRPVRVSVLAPGAKAALVPDRRSWDAHVPVDAVPWIVEGDDPLSPWFAGDT